MTKLCPPVGRVLPIMAYTGTPRPKGYFFRPQVYERIGSSLDAVYERGGKSVISVGRKTQKS